MADEGSTMEGRLKRELESNGSVSNLSSGINRKRKQSRKEMRKEFRSRKKARIHAHFACKSRKKEHHIGVTKKELESVATDQNSAEKFKAKKKKKKKKKRINTGEPSATYQQSAYLYKNEDEEIKDLEKKLKLSKQSNLPKAFFEEGLSDIIDVCNAIETGSLKQHVQDVGDEDDFLLHDNSQLSDDDVYMKEEEIFDEEEKAKSVGDDTDNDLEDESEDESVDEDPVKNISDDEWQNIEDDEVRPKTEKSPCDIYGGATSKYVPPHQRNQNPRNCSQVNERLRKQVKGLLNRLSESNLSMISGQMEELYMSNSRNDLNEILSQLLMDACILPSLMPEGMLREHMMLIAILNSLIGSEIGAFLLQKLAIQFQKLHSVDNDSNDDKRINNIVTLFAFLYSFKVIDCILIYDIIRELVSSFREQDVELLLLVIRLIGIEIRRERPESLKEIILEVQAKAASDTELTNSSRTRFMLESINALRNNNIRKIPNYDPSPVERARKILRSVTKASGHDDDGKLSISLSDLLSADEKGRWWVVGSAWSEREKTGSSALGVPEILNNSNIIQLSREQRMNTDNRRNIFCTIMTSEDYIDAFEKLMRLKLKGKQTREIIYVLMDCSLQEKSYNPFYAYLLQKLCEFSKNYKMTVQFSLWDRFKMVSTLSDKNLSNMAHLIVHLLVVKTLSLSVFKVVDFTSLDKKLVNFFTETLTHLFMDYPESTCRDVFMRIAPMAKLETLKESLKLFMKHILKPKQPKPSSLINQKLKTKDKDRILDERINIAVDVLSGSS